MDSATQAPLAPTTIATANRSPKKTSRPSPRGPLSPGPRGRIAGSDGITVNTNGPKQQNLELRGWSDHGQGVVSSPRTPTSPSNGMLSAARRYLPLREGGGWVGGVMHRSSSAGAEPPLLLSGCGNGEASKGSARRSSVPARPVYSPPTPAGAAQDLTSFGEVTSDCVVGAPGAPGTAKAEQSAVPSPGVAAAAATVSVTGDRPAVGPHPRDRVGRLSLGHPTPRHRLDGRETGNCMLPHKSRGWDALPSPEPRHTSPRLFTPASGRPGHPSPTPPTPPPPPPPFPPPPSTGEWTIDPTSGTDQVSPIPMVYGPHLVPPPHHTLPLNHRYSSPEPHLSGDKPQPHSGTPHFGPLYSQQPQNGPPQGPHPKMTGMGMGHQHQHSQLWLGGSPVSGGGQGSMLRGGNSLPQSPPKPIRSNSEPPQLGTNDPKEYYANRTTVAAERLRRRRLEGLEQQQQQQRRYFQHSRSCPLQKVASVGDWRNTDHGNGVSGVAAPAASESSPGCNRCSSGSAGMGDWSNVGARRQHSPTGMAARGQRPSSPSIGIGAMNFASAAAAGGGWGRSTSSGQPGSPASSIGSPFRRVDRRSRTPPLREGRSDEDSGVDWGVRRPSSSYSQSPTRKNGNVGSGRLSPPPSTRGRSESVPSRPRSWTGPRSASALAEEVVAAAGRINGVNGDAVSEGRSSPDRERQTLGILLPLDYSG